MKTPIRRIFCFVCATWLCGALTFPNTAQATLFDYDPFNYSGATLPTQNGGTGWNAGWFTTGTSAVNGLSNDGISLSYPMTWESPLVPLPSSGSRVVTGGTTGNANTSRLLSQTINLSVDGTVMYASALFRKNTANGSTANDNILLEFVDSSANRRWGFGIEGTGDKPWLNANGSTSPAGPAVTAGDTYFIVAKIVSSASGTDSAFLKVYGTGYNSQVTVAEPTTWDATLTETTSAILDRIRIRIDSGNALATPAEVDEIRIGNTWLDVVSVPEPSSMTLLGLGLVAGWVWKRRA
jgi:hypothetical protein